MPPEDRSLSRWQGVRALGAARGHERTRRRADRRGPLQPAALTRCSRRSPGGELIHGHDRACCCPGSSSPPPSRSTSSSPPPPSDLAAWLVDARRRPRSPAGRPIYRRLFDFWRDGVRGCIRHGRRLGHRHGLPVRHQLERAVAPHRRHPGSVARLREFHRLRVGGELLRSPDAGAGRGCRAGFYLVLVPDGGTLGTTMSSFWIMVNNSWMQAPTGFAMMPDGVFRPTNWNAIIFNSGGLGALPAHAVRGLRHLGLLRRGDGGVASCSEASFKAGIAHIDAADGARAWLRCWFRRSS